MHPIEPLEGYGSRWRGVKEDKASGSRPQLKLLSQMLEDDVANQGGDERDDEIGQRQDVIEGVSQRFAAAAGDGEFAH